MFGPLGRDLLAAFIDVGLEHHADDGGLAGAELVGYGAGDEGLVGVVFGGVACAGYVRGWGKEKGVGGKGGGTYRASSLSS